MLETIASYVPQLFPYLSVTAEYVVLSLVFGTALALVLLAMKLSRFRLLRGFAFGYTTVLRCTPSIVLLFLAYYGVPPLVRSTLGINIDKVDAIVFTIVAFTLFLGGSISEIMRSAYEAIDKSQLEAAECAGLTRRQAMRRIIAPQVLYLMIPNIGNTLQFLIKEGALVYMIGVIDITGKAYTINANNYGNDLFAVYLALALIFWVISLGIDYACKLLERSLGRGYRKPQPAGSGSGGGPSKGAGARVAGKLGKLGKLRFGKAAS